MSSKNQFKTIVTIDEERRAKRHAKGRIFIIDDESMIVDALDTLLSAHGFQCEKYESAKQFIEAAPLTIPSFHGPRCILCDVNMPGMRGLELLEQISDEAPPIILMSGMTTPAEVIQGFRGGLVSFLLKPIESQELLQEIDKALSLDLKQQAMHSENKSLSEKFSQLTSRELEVVTNIFNGLTNQEISDKLGIALRTTKLYRKNAMDKLGAENSARLIRTVAEWQKDP